MVVSRRPRPRVGGQTELRCPRHDRRGGAPGEVGGDQCAGQPTLVTVTDLGVLVRSPPPPGGRPIQAKLLRAQAHRSDRSSQRTRERRDIAAGRPAGLNLGVLDSAEGEGRSTRTNEVATAAANLLRRAVHLLGDRGRGQPERAARSQQFILYWRPWPLARPSGDSERAAPLADSVLGAADLLGDRPERCALGVEPAEDAILAARPARRHVSQPLGAGAYGAGGDGGATVTHYEGGGRRRLHIATGKTSTRKAQSLRRLPGSPGVEAGQVRSVSAPSRRATARRASSGMARSMSGNSWRSSRRTWAAS